MSLNAIGEAVADVQNVQPPDTETPSVFLATACVDFHTTEDRCFRALLDQGSTFYFRVIGSGSARTDTAPI